MKLFAWIDKIKQRNGYYLFPKELPDDLYMELAYGDKVILELEGNYGWTFEARKKTGINLKQFRELANIQRNSIQYEFRNWDGSLMPNPFPNAVKQWIQTKDGQKPMPLFAQ